MGTSGGPGSNPGDYNIATYPSVGRRTADRVGQKSILISGGLVDAIHLSAKNIRTKSPAGLPDEISRVNIFMATRTTTQRKEANKLISKHRVRATQKGLEIPEINASIWRYIDLPKLLDMLASDSLPLIRVDKFDDKWEGFSSPLSHVEYRGFFAEPDRKADLERLESGEHLRNFYYASCWHLNEIESDAMWKLYLRGNEGIAIRTTYQKLIFSLREASEEFLIGKVKYPKKTSPGLSMLLTCMKKREPFKHENELRIIWHNSDAEIAWRKNVLDSATNCHAQPSVKRLRCDFNQLIEEVKISPKAGEWFDPAVRNLLEKYGLQEVKVSRSGLYGDPPWPNRIE